MSRARNFSLCFSIFVFFLTGCKSTYSEKTVSNGPAPLLHNSTRIYIGLPFDATYKNKVAQGSAKQTAQALYAAFDRYSTFVFLGKLPESLDDALESARKATADYLVYPSILKWEDHATEWSGRRDRLEVKVDLVDAKTGQIVFSREIDGTGKWMTDGGDTPGDLLPGPCEEYVNALFRRIEKPSALW